MIGTWRSTVGWEAFKLYDFLRSSPLSPEQLTIKLPTRRHSNVKWWDNITQLHTQDCRNVGLSVNIEGAFISSLSCVHVMTGGWL